MPGALGQLDEARQWWLQHRDKAPSAFDEEVMTLLGILKDRPTLVGRPVVEPPGVRRVYLARIRYYVYFQISLDDGAVEILALWHGSRASPPKL